MGDSTQTLDTVCRGALSLHQPAHGYRFNVDSVLLAHFVANRCEFPPSRVVDLGAGVGVVGLLLACRWQHARLELVEIQPELAQLADKNVQCNGFSGRVTVRQGDMRKGADGQPEAALVVANPPFYPLGAGRENPDPQLAAARHEINCTLTELMQAAAARLSADGHLGLVHLAQRAEEVMAAAARQGLTLSARRLVRPFADRQPTRVLALFVRGNHRPISQPTDVVVERRPGRYTAEMVEILSGDWLDITP